MDALALNPIVDPARTRYEQGAYDAEFGDDNWKGRQMANLIAAVVPRENIRTYADIGCGNGGVMSQLHGELCRAGFLLQSAVGYDVAPMPSQAASDPRIVFRRADFLNESQIFDLITLNDVIEHVAQPQHLLQHVAEHARYVALHIPLDDRLSVALTNQYNYRLDTVGHISFWNASSAINLLTSVGLLPVRCRFTPGFLAPSGRKRLVQWASIPLRFLVWIASPPLAARTVGGISLAVICRGRRA